MKGAKRNELSVGTHVLLHPADGGKGLEVAVIERDALRGVYLLRLRDGSVVESQRERIELDPMQYPTSGALRMHSFPVQFVVLSGPLHQDVVKLISDNGGEVVTSSRSQHCYTIHSGASVLGGSALANKVYNKELLEHAIKEADFAKVLRTRDQFLVRPPAPRTVSNGRNRRLFTPDEDDRILAFVVEKTKAGTGGSRAGNKLWEMAEEEQICPGRSWMSLKERFKKHLELRFHNLSKGGSIRVSARGKGSATEEETVRDHVQIGGEGKPMDTEESDEEEDDEAEEEDDDEAENTRLKDKRKAECIEQIELLSSRYKVPRAVVVHAGVLSSGDLALAERYLMDKDDVSHLVWTHQEDAHLIDDDAATAIRDAIELAPTGLKVGKNQVAKIEDELHQILKARGLKSVQERCDWIHSSE